MQFASNRVAGSSGWLFGTRPVTQTPAIHQCNINDHSTWQKVAGQTEPVQGKWWHKCKGCPVKMLR